MDAIRESEHRGSTERAAPGSVVALLVAFVPVVLALQVAATIVAALVIPIGDGAPLAALVIALAVRRYSGVTRRLFTVIAVLSVLMIAEWLPMWFGVSALFMGAHVGDRIESMLMLWEYIYVPQSGLLVLLAAVASVASIIGIIRARRVISQETT